MALMHFITKNSIAKNYLLINLLAIAFMLGSCSYTQYKEKVTVSARLQRVVSGQTIEVIISTRDSQPQKVRMIGIDVPKLNNEEWSDRAKERLKELIPDNQLDLELESDELDRYNRLLAHVWYRDTLLGEQLAKEGYVIANTKYPHRHSDRIFHAQEYARILGYGIWE